VGEVLGGGSARSIAWPTIPCRWGAELDWVIKHQLIENYMAKHDLVERLPGADDRPAVHDIRPTAGPLRKAGGVRAVERIVNRRRDLQGIYDPPRTAPRTSAGVACSVTPRIVSASWDSVIFDLKEGR